jgi:ubiquinone/menaquinone biosynthesis C-methylase UbiE
MPKKEGMSRTFYTVRYLRRSREIYRRYLESKPWVRQQFREFLQLRPGIRIVDIGCGTGDFTRYVVRLVPGNCQALGIDSRASSLRAAELETRTAGLSDKISYKQGDAYNLPVADGYSDLTCCRSVLMHLQDPLQAVKEMTRITKRGGLVAAEEPGKMISLYDPDDEDFTKLARKIYPAYHEGIRKLEGKDYEIGERLPTIFREAGLGEIRAEALGNLLLPADSRTSIRDVKAQIQMELGIHRETKADFRRALKTARVSSSKIALFLRLQETQFRGLLGSGKGLRDNTTFFGSVRYLVTGRSRVQPKKGRGF